MGQVGGSVAAQAAPFTTGPTPCLAAGIVRSGWHKQGTHLWGEATITRQSCMHLCSLCFYCKNNDFSPLLPLSIYLSIHLSIYPSIHLSIYPSIIIYPSIHLSICLLNYSIYLQSAINNYTEDLALCAVYVGGKCGILNAQVRPLNRTICDLACWPHHSMLLSDSRFAVAFIRFGPFWCVPLSWFLDTCQTI